MDSKRPDVDLDEKPDEDGRVTKWDRGGGGSDRSVLSALRRLFGR